MWLRPLLLVVLLARFADSQVPDTTHRAPGATVRGVVHDSIVRMPLVGAVVQLVAADSLARFGRTAVSDSLGRFTLGDVPDGRYTLGFFHPMLDSLGIEPPLRGVYVDGHRDVRADLGVPSPERLRAAICGPRSAQDSGAVAGSAVVGGAVVAGAIVVGIVRDAREGTPAAGVTVTGEWLELFFSPDGLVRRFPRLVATTGGNGWFALCNVPSGGTMALTASRGADSTDRIEVQVPAGGFLRRELYIGPVRAVVTGDTTRHADPVSPAPRRLRLGDGRLRGTVVTADGNLPLAGALVRITDGPQVRANERGEWTLVDAPAGTRMLEVRAVGYYPERRPVDVVAGAAPVRVALFTFKAVLDTVKVTAARLADRRNSGFADRRRSGVGHFLTPEDIAQRGAIVTSDLFRMIPGVHVETDTGPERRIVLHGCSPAIYIDGQYMPDISADDIDDWMRPNRVVGIEVYSEAAVPAQYQRALAGCGAILIWTK